MNCLNFTILVIVTIIVSYGNCSNSNEDSDLDPAEVEEPGCPNVGHLKTISEKGMLGQWHLPYLSNHWIRYMAKSMHGKFMKRSSMGKFCIKVNVKPMPPGAAFANDNATVWIQSKCPRTGAQINLACSIADENHNAKFFCNDKNGKNKDADSFVYVVDTDNKSWALVVRCFPNNGMNWAIFSKQKTMEKNVVKMLLAKVEEMGFKLFNIVEIPASKCKQDD